MPKIFVSYRRKSSEGITGRIVDRLVAQYGKDSVFVDIDSIAAGADFRERINQVLNEADVVIAIVGPQWLESGKQAWTDQKNDWVRVEIEAALRRNALIIPVLVDGASMPGAGDLPDSIRDFAYRTAVVVAGGQDFHSHVDRLIRSIDRIGTKRIRFSQEYIKRIAAVVALILALSALGYYAIFHLFVVSQPEIATQPEIAPQPVMAGGVTEQERRMSKSAGAAIQANLCVPLTGTFNSATRAAIRQAKWGANQSSASAMPFSNVQDQIMSAGEAQIFLASGSCRLDASRTDRGYRSAFEKFAFRDEAGVKSLQSLLAVCDPDLRGKLSGSFDAATRTAIKTAKVKLSAARRAELTDLNTDTLTDKSYEAIARTCI